jgi:uncharacterized repeat protein (TIGR03833 family)
LSNQLGSKDIFTSHQKCRTIIQLQCAGSPFAGNNAGVSMKDIHHVKISPGLHVRIVLKKDQRSGKLTEGIVKDVLTKSPSHPHGIKVRLESGEVGRVKEILEAISK